MRYVLDSSVAFKWVVAETDTDKALQIRDNFRTGVIELLTVDIFPTELANALIVAERRGRILPGQSAVLFAEIAKTIPVLASTLPDLIPAAMAIAGKTRISLYDGLYVALAVRESCELITADQRLVKALDGHFPEVKSLASLP
jgi:predicted nucleic acid-binding protein